MVVTLRKYLLVVATFCWRRVSASDVLAHFMVQNSYSYSKSTWQADFSAAKDMGIDGFALNWVPPNCQSPDLGWQVDRINDAFTVAASEDFKLVYSFDMSYAPGQPDCPLGTAWNQTFIASMVSKYASSPATYKYGNAILVTTFAGELYGNDFFQGLKYQLSSQGIAISLTPALTSYSDAAQSDASAAADDVLEDYASIDGYFNWQAWPLDIKQNLTATADLAFKSALLGKGRSGPYIMAISPWQFKDLNDGSSSNSWVQYSDNLFPHRWVSAMMAVKPPIIELISWNDWAESHYLRAVPPSSETGDAAAQLGEQGNYVYGIEHAGWRVMAKYYIQWYKTGKRPKIVAGNETAIFWYRVHPKDAVCAGGANQSPAVKNSDFPDDAVFVWAVAEDAAVNVTVTVGGSLARFEVLHGGPKVGMVLFPAELGGGIKPVVEIGDGEVVLARTVGSVAITHECEWENFNPVVAIVGPGF